MMPDTTKTFPIEIGVYNKLCEDKACLLAALESFIKTEQCLGWKEGECDVWLGPTLEQAKHAIAKAKAES